jgi:hypothetical protein
MEPDGVYVTWFDSRVGDRGADILLGTIRSVFSDCWLGAIRSTYYLLVCSNEPIRLHRPHAAADEPVLAAYFRGQGLDPRAFGYGVLSTHALDLAGDRSIRTNTLDAPTLEFEIASLARRGIRGFKQRLEDQLDLSEIGAAFAPEPYDPVAAAAYQERLLGKDSLPRRYRELAHAAAQKE